MHPTDPKDEAAYRVAVQAVAAHIRDCPRVETEYGVMRDLRARGLGIQFVTATKSAQQAQTRAAQLRAQGDVVEIKQRLVITLPWQDTSGETDEQAGDARG